MKKIYDIIIHRGVPELETIEVINEHYMCDGASEETYLCRHLKDRKAFICSKEMYQESPKKAWDKFYKQLEQAINTKREEILQAQEEIEEYEAWLKKAIDNL